MGFEMFARVRVWFECDHLAVVPRCSSAHYRHETMMSPHVDHDIATTDMRPKREQNILLEKALEQHVPRQQVREGSSRPKEIELAAAKLEGKPEISQRKRIFDKPRRRSSFWRTP